jgi:hypothetical protein
LNCADGCVLEILPFSLAPDENSLSVFALRLAARGHSRVERSVVAWHGLLLVDAGARRFRYVGRLGPVSSHFNFLSNLLFN